MTTDIDDTPSLIGFERTPPRVRILGTPVSCINLDVAREVIFGWIRGHTTNYVCVRDVHGVMLCRNSPKLREIHENAGLVTPDGMPLVWLTRLKSDIPGVARVCGPDLLEKLCKEFVDAGVRHFFYGGKEGVAEQLTRTLCSKYPGLIVAGAATPPFRELTDREMEKDCEEITLALADIVWVGLSSPKQELWMARASSHLRGVTLIGVGAAFDFSAGTIKRAPKSMRNVGLEWLYRLITEPRRLWKRYLLLAPKFAWLVACELILGVSR